MFNVLAIKEIQIKTTLRFYLAPVRMAIMKKTTTNAGEDAGEKEPHTLLVGMKISASTMKISMKVH
jgi:hypothetical protein